MKNEFLIQMEEKVNAARNNAKNINETRALVEKAKKQYIKCIQYHWLNSIPETLEADGTFLVTACIAIGKRGFLTYSFDFPNGELTFSGWSEPAGIIEEIVDELSQLVGREVKYKIHDGYGSWSLEVSFYW